jgi:integrase
MQRATSTIQDYRIILERHLGPYFDAKALDRIEPDDVVGYMAVKRRAGLSAKTIQNHVTFLHGLMKWSIKRGWAGTNPVAAVDHPPVEATDPDIRFLTLDEVEAVIREVAQDVLGPTDRALYLAAAMCGARQGELVALRWRDVDWTARKIRIRRKRYRGEDGKPKSRRGSRSIPLADRLARELEHHFQRSAYQADDNLVFCHPETGNPYDPSKMGSRFEAAMDAAGMADRYGRDDGITFHSFRHTFATRCAAAGVPLRTLQEWLGHRAYKTGLIYADYQPDDRREAALVKGACGMRTLPTRYVELITRRSRVRIPPPLLRKPRLGLPRPAVKGRARQANAYPAHRAVASLRCIAVPVFLDQASWALSRATCA